MDWISGMQKAIDYIEDHLTDDINYEVVAAQSYSSSYHFQRVFAILCGYTLGEYIRYRRLSCAGAELGGSDTKVIDVAMKYGYDSPVSFSRAFAKFHGVNPSEARGNGQMLKSFSRLVLKLSLEGGSIMDYRIEEKPEMILTGFKKRFAGTPENRYAQQKEFHNKTRLNQYLLAGMNYSGMHYGEHSYNIIMNLDDDGFDYYIAEELDEWYTNNFAKALGYDEKANEFEKIVIPKQLYVICETERINYPATTLPDLRRRIVSEWLPSSGYRFAAAPEVECIHWHDIPQPQNNVFTRYIELWIPIEKVE